MVDKLKIAHLIYSQEIGGSETVALNICSHLDRSLFEPLVLFLYERQGGPMGELLTKQQIPWHCLKMNRWKRLLRPWLIARTLKRLEVDILHIHHLNFYLQVRKGADIAGLKGTVLTEHSYRQLHDNPVMQAKLQQAAKEVDFFTVISRKMQNDFVHNFGVNSSLIHVIYNGVDTERFSPEYTSKRPTVLPSGANCKILLSVGRLVKEKDHATLLYALQLLVQAGEKVHSVIVGDGPLRNEIETLATRLGVREHLTLTGTRNDIVACLHHADIFVLSSRSEGLPMVLLEAMATGLPVVSTGVGGIAEIIEDGISGLLVPPESPKQLAEAIRIVLVHEELRQKMTIQARQQIFDRYCQKKITEEYCRIYSAIGMKAPIEK